MSETITNPQQILDLLGFVPFLTSEPDIEPGTVVSTTWETETLPVGVELVIQRRLSEAEVVDVQHKLGWPPPDGHPGCVYAYATVAE